MTATVTYPDQALALKRPTERRMEMLDGLRALALMTVLIEHWLPRGPFVAAMAKWGTLGVFLFFVLSGYLITGILLRCRTEIDASNESRWFVLRQFYIRRALRIFPPYYALLLIMTVMNLPGAREGFWWHAAYLSNVWVFLISESGGGAVGHLWTLAVEEQFYLIWPWLILLVHRRAILPLIGSLIIAGSVVMFFSHKYGFTGMGGLLPGAMPFLGMGALLSAIQWQVGSVGRKRLLWFMTLTSLPAVAAAIWYQIDAQRVGWHVVGLDKMYLFMVMRHLALAMIFGWMVLVAAQGLGGPARWVLTFQPIAYLGRISYGYYLIHIPMLWFIPMALQHPWMSTLTGLTPQSPVLNHFGFRFAAGLALAAMSWHLFEAPINRLKSHFPYVREKANRRTRPPPVMAAAATSGGS